MIQWNSRILYFFLFVNTFLTGLFNFFLPLYLLEMHYTFSQVSLYVSINALGFFFFLFFLEKLLCKYDLLRLSAITYLAEAVYLSVIYFFINQPFFIPVLGMASGIYLSLFWVIQRLLFLEATTHKNIGRTFGNMQIFLVIVGQVAVYVGSFLLERFSFLLVYQVSLLVLLFAIVLSILSTKKISLMKLERQTSFIDLLSFKDKLRSRSMFIIDGFFLFLESHYWLMVLFLFMEQNFFHLGTVLILLSIPFGIVHIFIKNRIDHMDVRLLYVIFTSLYAVSWFLRPIFMHSTTMTVQYGLLIVITFVSLYFRLVLNKLYFQVTKKEGPSYILTKSYYTQFSIFVIFLLVSGVFHALGQNVLVFELLFYVGTILSPVYLLYCPRKEIEKMDLLE